MKDHIREVLPTQMNVRFDSDEDSNHMDVEDIHTNDVSIDWLLGIVVCF